MSHRSSIMDSSSGTTPAARRLVPLCRPLGLVALWLSTASSLGLAHADITTEGTTIDATTRSSDSRKPSAAADDVLAHSNLEFDPHLLHNWQGRINLDRFTNEAAVPPGQYSLDIRVNETPIGRRMVRIAPTPPDEVMDICVDDELLLALPLRARYQRQFQERLANDRRQLLAALSTPAAPLTMTDACRSLASLIPDARSALNMPELSASLSIPLLYLDPRPGGPGTAAPSHGIDAFRLRYDTNYYRTTGSGGIGSLFAAVDAGANLLGWQFRHGAQLIRDDRVGRLSLTSNSTYVRRALGSRHSMLTLGDSFSAGTVFDPIGIRGLQIGTDEASLPSDERGAAPVVRGHAHTNGRVQIKQNGRVLKEVNVVPGPFEIDDIPTLGAMGDLTVTVLEADGSVRSSTVPNSAPHLFLQESAMRYNVLAGRIRHVQFGKPAVQIEGLYGLTSWTTLSAGLQLAPRYRGLLLGGRFSTLLGALSLSAARSSFEGSLSAQFNGLMVKAALTKDMSALSSSFALQYARYGGTYLSLAHVGGLDGFELPKVALIATQTPRSQFLGRVHTRLGPGMGALFLQYVETVLSFDQGRDASLMLGYSFPVGSGYLSLTGTAESLRSTGRRSRSISVSYTLPLAPLGGTGGQTAVQYQQTSRGEPSAAITSIESINWPFPGTASLSARREGHSHALSGGLSLDLPSARVLGSFNQGISSRQFGFAASGGLVATSGGVAFSPSLGETVGVVELVEASSGTGPSGQGPSPLRGEPIAVVPFVPAYRPLHELGALPALAGGARYVSESLSVMPTTGAVVPIQARRPSGVELLVPVRQADGAAVPFGADILDDAGNSVGVVGQASLANFRARRGPNVLTATWGTATSFQSCRFGVDATRVEPGRLHTVESTQTCRQTGPIQDM